jgi:hypothetical protein
VEIVNRIYDNCVVCLPRLENTLISLWRDGTKVLDCGTITDVDLVSFEEADQTYTVDCGGGVGDAVKMDGEDSTMNFAEIRIYKPGSGRS